MTGAGGHSRSAAGMRIGLLSFNGLGDITAEELGVAGSRYHKSAVRDYDFVTLPADTQMISRLASLRTVEDVFVMLGRVKDISARRDLHRLTGHITRARILDAIALRNRCFPSAKPRSVSFKCFVKQDHDYRLRRSVIEQFVEGAIMNLFPRWRIADPAALEIWAFYIDGTVDLGLRLSTAAMKYRGRKPPQRKGALRPTIAGALVAVANIAPGEKVIDPMCGTGTVVSEVLDLHRAACVVGGDIDAAALSLTACRRQDESLIVQMDGTKLPLPDASFDCAICNLPFGRQYASPAVLDGLYSDCLAELKRVLMPGGRMVLLTAASHELARAAAKLQLSTAGRYKVKVLGLTAEIRLVSCA